MKHLIVALVLFCAATLSAAPPSDASLDELFKRMNLRGTIDQMLANMGDGMKTGMQQGLQQSMKGRELTADQRRQFDNLQNELMSAMRDELSYDKLKDIYQKAYRETFTQEEIAGLIAFFNSPAGKAYIEKLPKVMQRTDNEIQGRIGPLVQKLNAMQQQFLQQLESSAGSSKP